jgi:hypothetical protein
MSDSPTPPEPDAGPAEYARHFAALASALRLTLSEQSVAHVRHHLSRFWPNALDDLVGCTLLECLEARPAGGVLSEDEILRALDRVRHRLTREAKRFQNGELAETAAEQVIPPDEELELVLSEFRAFLATRDAGDAFLFQRHYLDGVSPQELADEMGIALSTVYRRLKAIRDDFVSRRAS